MTWVSREGVGGEEGVDGPEHRDLAFSKAAGKEHVYCEF